MGVRLNTCSGYFIIFTSNGNSNGNGQNINSIFFQQKIQKKYLEKRYVLFVSLFKQRLGMNLLKSGTLDINKGFKITTRCRL